MSKKSKIMFFVVGIIMALTASIGAIFLSPNNEQSPNAHQSVYASCTKTNAKTITTDRPYSQISTNRTPSSSSFNMGDIPFSIYTSQQVTGGYSIIDYIPTFETSEDANNFYYKIEDSSIPYILLSSNGNVPDGSLLQEYYNTTFYFKFNDPDITKNSSSGVIGSNTGTVGYIVPTSFTLSTPYSSTPLDLWPNITQPTGVNDAGLTFAVNLLDINDDNVECPILNDSSSGELNRYVGDGDVSFRTGLYTIKIEYLFTNAGIITDHVCHFEISFYILDYSEYVEVQDDETIYSPLKFENADLYSYQKDGDIIDTGYNVFNYNYPSSPKVKFDATKFGLNFEYTVPATKKVFSFKYKNFEYLPNGETAKVYIGSDGLDDFVITIPKDESNKFIATFDLDDFQDYILQNSITLGTSSYQGTYSFDMNMLTRSNSEYNFSVVSKDTLDDSLIYEYNSQKLLIFGYELKYNDKSSSSTNGKDVSMASDTSWTTFIAQNNVTNSYSINIPEIIAVTNQAPLRFSNFGNLYGISDYHARFYKLSNTSVSSDYFLYERSDNEGQKEIFFGDIVYKLSNYNEEVKEYETLTADESTPASDIEQQENKVASAHEKLLTSITTLKTNINSQSHDYTQGLAISGDGLYLMLLQYRIRLDVALSDGSKDTKDITGEQFVVFQINNTPQTLYPHAIERVTNNGSIVDTYYTFNTYTNLPVRISTIDSSSSFYAPVTLEYAYYADFNQNSSPIQGRLIPKTNGTYSLGTTDDGEGNYVGGTKYQYYVTGDDSNYYTFKDSGTYVITVRSAVGSSSSKTVITIDNRDFEDISIYNVDTSGSGYYKDAQTKQSLNNSMLAITNKPFTLSWAEKSSSINSLNKCKANITFMSLDKNENSVDLIKEGSEYWMTNNYTFGVPIREIEKNYENSYSLSQLSSKMFFKKDGLYIFYVYDLAGNHFSRLVLLDSTSPEILQGNWSRNDEDIAGGSTWTEDEILNEANYISKETTIYFGSHKALSLPSVMTSDENSFSIEIADSSYTNAYDENGVITTKENANVFDNTSDLYEYLKTLNNFVRKSTTNPIITSKDNYNQTYYLLLKNDYLSYSINDGDSEIIDNPTDYAKIKIYRLDANQTFYGENRYLFTLHNQNDTVSIKGIEMYFDTIQGTFYAYKDSINDRHIISKNSGTNLNVLMFNYSDVNVTSEAYEIDSLIYNYYPFDFEASISSYPFSATATRSGVDLLSQAQKDGDYWDIDDINVDYSSGGTLPGKYEIVRTYRGGEYNRVSSDTPDAIQGSDGYYYKQTSSGKGGYYHLVGQNDFEYLFGTDTLVRTYVVYVDRNSIISTTYDSNGHKEIGDNISITLNYGLTNDSWSFADFYKMLAENNDLITNKIPVRINIPLSKYYSRQNDTFYYATRNFAKLNVTVNYKPILGATQVYTSDSSDNMGYLTCSSLVSGDNPNGYLIFSKEGTYTITITDGTGYNNYSSTTASGINIEPNSFEFTFYIEYSSPQANVYTTIINGDSSNTQELTSDDLQNNFATNIKSDNEVYIAFNDPATPYTAKVSRIEISASDGNVFSFDLTDSNSRSIADSDSKIWNLNSNLVKAFEIDYYSSSEADVFDGENYYRFAYKLYLNIDKEITYIVKFSYLNNDSIAYIGANGEDFSSSNYELSIDRTKPMTNVLSLLEQEIFLSQSYYKDGNLTTFLEENFYINSLQNTPSTFTYAFPIKNNYMLVYNADETLPYFYVRNYHKFDSDIIADRYPSITPDMVSSVYDENHSYYNNETALNGYPKFSEVGLNDGIIYLNNCTWYKVNYNTSLTLSELIKNAMNVNSVSGYYEIIEKDNAGNYRSFTVYYTTSNKYSLISYSGKDEEGITITPTTQDITKQEFALESLSSTLGWANVTLERRIGDSVRGSDQITLTPYKNYISDDAKQSLNTNIFRGDTDRTIVISLLDYNQNFSGISRRIFLSSGETDLGNYFDENIIIASNNTYTIKLPPTKDEAVVHLTYFKLQLWQNGGFLDYLNYEFDEDIEFETNRTISNLPQGRYRILYKDNTSDELKKHALPLGEFSIKDATKEYVFDYDQSVFDEDTNTYYSGGNVTVTYEGNKYRVLVNNIVYSGDDDKESLSSEYAQYNCKTFTLSSPYSSISDTSSASGGTTVYEIKYYDSIDTDILQKTVRIVIFDKLPEILLTSGAESSVQVPSSPIEISSLVTNTSVRIDWANLTAAPIDSLNDPETKNDTDSTRVTYASLYKKNDSGNYEYISRVLRGTNNLITDEGSYRIDITNRLLGNSRPVYFNIKLGDFPLYSVTANNREITPSTLELLNISKERAYASEGVSQTTNIINIIYNELLSLYNEGYLHEMIQRDADEFSLLCQELGFDTNGDFSFENIGISNVASLGHYYTIYDFDITINSIIELTTLEFVFKNDVFVENNPLSSFAIPSNVGSDYYTKIYLVYTFDGPIKVELFAVTKVPTKTNLLNGYIYTNGRSISLTDYALSRVISNDENLVTNEETTLAWNLIADRDGTEVLSKWYNQGNYVYVLDNYGYDVDIYSPLDFALSSDRTNRSESLLVGSGTHTLMFMDFAGNTHRFQKDSRASETYKLSLLDRVIYYIAYKDTSFHAPIQYGVFNDSLTMILDPEYLTSEFYTASSVTVSATRNGLSYSVTKVEGDTKGVNNVIKFTEPGKYVVTLNAKYNGKDLNPAVYNFTILSSTSAKLAFEFVEIPGYGIEKVVRNDVDITSNFVDSTGKVKSLFLSASSSTSGNGKYVVTLRYGSGENDVLQFSVSINDFMPTIYCNVERGGSTTGEIVISFDSGSIYQEIGTFTLKVLRYNSDSNTFYQLGSGLTFNEENSTPIGTRNTYRITESNTYFIQLETENGNIITSFKVTKNDPLNAFAIIIIIVAIVGTGVLIFVIIKLRTKMKIR